MNLHEKLAEYCIEQMCEKGDIVYSSTRYYFIDSKNYPNVHSVDIQLDTSKGFLGVKKHKLFISVNIRTREITSTEFLTGINTYQQIESYTSTNSELINRFIKLQKLGKVIEEKRAKERELQRLKMFETAVKNTVQGIVK